MFKSIIVLTILSSFLFIEGTKAQDSLQIKAQSMDKIISGMTVDEKISLLVGDGDGEFSEPHDAAATAVVGSTQKYVPGAPDRRMLSPD